MIIDSETGWNQRPKSAPTLADLFLRTIGADKEGFQDVLGHTRWATGEREMGADFSD